MYVKIIFLWILIFCEFKLSQKTAGKDQTHTIKIVDKSIKTAIRNQLILITIEAIASLGRLLFIIQPSFSQKEIVYLKIK